MLSKIIKTKLQMHYADLQVLEEKEKVDLDAISDKI